MEFKVGDKVRILGGTEKKGWVFQMIKTIGAVGKITDAEIVSPKYRVMFEDDDQWCYNEEDLEKENDMEDLRKLIKPCYAVKFRNGNYAITFMRKDNGINFNRIEDISNGVTKLSDFDENLMDNDGYSHYDIMEIRGYADVNQKNIEGRGIIWKREEKAPTQLKLEELEKKQREIADEMKKLRKEQYGI